MKRLQLACVSTFISVAAFATTTVPNPGVVLINPFEAKPGREAECLSMWHRAAEFLRSKPGFRSTVLHESMSVDSRFRFVNVAVWDSPQAFQAAVSDPAFHSVSATDACSGSPALYKVIVSTEVQR